MRLEFECITDRFSAGYLNLSDLLKNNKFTFSGLDAFQAKSSQKPKELEPEMYSIGDEDEEESGGLGVSESSTQKSQNVKSPKEGPNEFEEVTEDGSGEEFESDELDDDEYFKKLEEEA